MAAIREKVLKHFGLIMLAISMAPGAAGAVSITTIPGGTVLLGSGIPMKDSATLSGGLNPTGTITFRLANPGNSVVDTETVPVAGNGTYTTPVGFVPTVAGTYQWVASYSGDPNNVPVNSTFGDEPESVSVTHPAITTTPGGTVFLGSGIPMKDLATLSGGFNPTGTITFTLANPGNTVVDTETVPVAGNGTYITPVGFVPTVAGTYQWVASYSGDPNNAPVNSAFGDEPESVSITHPVITTTPGGTVLLGSGIPMKDSATLSGGLNPTGTITFRLANPGNTVVDTETVPVAGNGTYTTPVGFVPTAAGTYQWVASYSGDPNNAPVNSTSGDEPESVIGAPPPTITKAFGAATIPLNGHTSLSFNVTNPNAFALTGISFSDALPSGLVVSTPNGLSTTCTGSITATAGSNGINFSGGTLAANGSCTFSVNVTGIAAGVQNNTTGPISSDQSGLSAATSNTASLIVISPPVTSKSFGLVAIPVGGSSSLSFTITNPNATVALTVSFTDTLPSGLVVSTPSGAVTTCLGGTLTANPGTNSISLSGAVIAATASCNITVDVTGVSAGVKNNTTGPVSSIEGGNGAPALASIFVGPAFQVRYTSNLSLGDGVINITNTGATGASLFGPGFGANVGNICVNVYAFSPDEQLISCCSCLVTPNGLASLSVVNDLTSNTLTGVRPGSIAVKLLSTVAGTGGSATDCTNSASTAVTTGTLADGLAAWGTSVHPSPTGTAVTETPFTPSTLSFGEAASVAARCTNIIGNGSTFGICRACRSGGLGGVR